MRKSLKLSAAALLTTALTVLPAHALSLNVGGDGPLVDLGNGNNADATVSVDTGNTPGGGNGGSDTDAVIDVDLGGGSEGDSGQLNSVIDDDGDGGLVNLGGDNDLVDLGGDGDSVIDLGGDGDVLDLGDTGSLLDLGGNGDVLDLGDGNLLDLGESGNLVDLAALDLGDGPLLDLTGDPASDGLVEVDLGGGDLLDLGETGGILDLGRTGDLLDLGNDGLPDVSDEGDDVALDLGNTQVGADLNTNGGGAPLAKITIGTGDDGAAGTGILPDTDGTATVGGGNAATVDLGTGGDGNGAGGGDGSGGAGNGNGNGSDDGSGSGGGNGSGSGNGNGSGNGGGTGNGEDGSDLFGATNADACITLNASQLQQLIARHTYNRSTFNSWASARSLKIVPVDFCDKQVADVAAAVGGSANVARLQAFLAAQAKVRAGLQSKGYESGDVIAADHSDGVLIVYVI